jgi:hypothetical protein
MAENKYDDLLENLKERFEKNMDLHKDIVWQDVQTRIKSSKAKLKSLAEMERTGGEPDVIGQDRETGEYLFFDCSEETPAGRRNVCYDHEALSSRKENRPETSAVQMAKEIGIELLTEDQYRELQKAGNYDNKTSSWLKTPSEIRKLGGAIFGDRRYDHVFIYHNGAESYYKVRGFRGCLKV